MILRNIEVDIKISVEELAKEFAALYSDEQAKFFSVVSEIVAEWKRPFVFQLQFISESEELTPRGRRLMQQIGEYSGYDQ